MLIRRFVNILDRLYGKNIRKIEELIWSFTALEIVSVLTLLLLLLHPYSHNYFIYPVQAILITAFFYRKILSSPWVWFFLAAFTSYIIYNYWHPEANHKFLTTYWLWVLCFAHFISSKESKERMLSVSARFLVMFTMLAACAQKLLSPTYMDGSFFEVTLLSEYYFEFFLATFGVDPILVDSTNQALFSLKSSNVQVVDNSITLPVTDFYSKLAMAVTVWNLLAQILLEVLGWFNRKSVQIVFHCFLLFFIHTTYIAAPFVGFGWLICLLGFSMSFSRFPRLSLLYLFSLFFMILYGADWRSLVF